MKGTLQIFLRGLKDGIPIALWYFAVAFSLGMIARKIGLNAWQGFLGSFFTRASAGEYGVYSLVAINAAYVEVVAICVVANLRYLLMGAALSQKFSQATSFFKRLMVACCITDEIFGISIAYPGKLAPAYTFGAMSIAAIFWACGTASGIVIGSVLPVNITSALSVALYGMFIAIIIPPSRKDKAVLVSVLAGFGLSWLCTILPYVSEINSGTTTILLTLIISALAAWIKPINITDDEE